MNRAKSIEEHYSISEAARRIGVHRNSIRNWIKSGRIPRIKTISRTCVRIPASSLQRLFI